MKNLKKMFPKIAEFFRIAPRWTMGITCKTDKAPMHTIIFKCNECGEEVEINIIGNKIPNYIIGKTRKEK